MSEGVSRKGQWAVPFFIIWTGQQLSLIGSAAAQFALIWWLTRTTGSATVLTTATLVALLPTIVLGPIAGAYIDRWNRRVVMIVADSMVALVSLWLAYLFWRDAMQVWHVYVVMLLRSLGGSFHWPAMAASTSLMVPEKHLARVAGLNQAMNGVLSIVGAPLGALLMELLPLHGVMLVDWGTAALAVIPLFFVRIPQPQRQERAQQLSIWSAIGEGLRYVRGWPGLVVLIGAALIFKIVLTPASSLLPLLVSQHFRGNAAQLSMMEAVLGAGILIGGLVLSAWGGFRRRILTTLSGIVIFSVCFAVLGLLPGHMFPVAVGDMFVVGLMLPMIDGPIMAIFQSNIAPEMQGRVFALLGSLFSLSSPIGLILAGPISDRLGLQVWYVAAGLLCGAIGLAGFFIPALVHIEENNNRRAPEPAYETT